MSQTPNPQSPSSEELDLVFWDPSGYKWNGSGDWNQWRYFSDGLGGEIGIRFGVSSGFGTFDWSNGGVPPHGSIKDGTGASSFGKNEQTGWASTSVNAVRMQANRQFTSAQNNFTIELDFSRYKGSKVGGKDGVAGANTLIGVSDIYAGLTYARTVVTFTGTLADGSAASPQGWKVINGGAAPPTAGGNQPSAQLSLANGVLQGTNRPAPGGMANSIDTVMGLVRLDAVGYKTLHLRYDIFPVGNNRAPRVDNSGLYVASAFPRKPARTEPPKAEEPVKPAEPPKAEKPVTPSTPGKPTVVIKDKPGKRPGATTSYTFTVKNPDGSIAGKGCFTYETPADGGEPKLTAFYYHDKVIGTINQANVQTFYFNQDDEDKRFTFVTGTPAKGICSLTADTTLPAQLTGIGGEGPQKYLGKTLEFPKLATGTTTTEESTSVPAVDLVVVIDSSVSMKDEADALNQAVGAAIEAAKTKCPSDLRVTYLGIEGTFKNTRFDTTVKNYLTGTAKADEAALRGRKKGSVSGGGAQEDGARAMEDVIAHYDWRAGAKRAVFFLGDEAFEGGGSDVNQEDIDAANRAIDAAKKGDVRLHTYLGTSGAKEKQRKALEAEFARAAAETGGKAFTSKDALNGFQDLLEKVICGSKSSTTTTTEFCCCQEYVEQT
ncbi:VWA domain-containing protein [Stigmatella sp. ncwal1]|uniref:VWA domain-containing protein n=1 Tax=Stigmatella ashevillensis TaxID=2995309 RepID=A0ABT5DHJ5_9BACT|nr:VWA domain-containing protein [Stigmatella ashevillena]MDC0712588.1 VWA domain-containing protein [Stigmatella ashevillena]